MENSSAAPPSKDLKAGRKSRVEDSGGNAEAAKKEALRYPVVVTVKLMHKLQMYLATNHKMPAKDLLGVYMRSSVEEAITELGAQVQEPGVVGAHAASTMTMVRKMQTLVADKHTTWEELYESCIANTVLKVS